MEKYQVEFLRHYLDAVANRPFVAGMHTCGLSPISRPARTSSAAGAPRRLRIS
ncbi:hypothetical protein [Methylobacter sp.]|uniref:hypothetical protein n=1 Tax=Methylobacter sp. TaxID=2051955 RepID=UPI003DA36476